MRPYVIPAMTAALLVAALSAGARMSGAPQSGAGTIRGRVRLNGKLPGNSVIRMGVDPMCSRLNAGKQVVQETVAAAKDGSLANVFVKLQGTFPSAPAPAQPVVIDQRACIYIPRVVGARVGQTLQVRNSDAFLHNVHAYSGKSNGFNVAQSKADVVHQFRLKDEEIMLRLKCDIHNWMTAYIGVVSHPYFAVSKTDGAFIIENAPAGTHTIEAWHERYGILTETVPVRPGATATVEFTYSADEGPGRRGSRQPPR